MYPYLRRVPIPTAVQTDVEIGSIAANTEFHVQRSSVRRQHRLGLDRIRLTPIVCQRGVRGLNKPVPRLEGLVCKVRGLPY